MCILSFFCYKGSYEKEKIKLSKKEKTSQEAYPDGTDHQNRHVDI